LAKLHHKSNFHGSQPTAPEKLLDTIHAFLRTCRTPAVWEEGGEIIRLSPGEYAIEIRAGRLWVEAWPETSGLSRRILSVDSHKPGVLHCSIGRFGGEVGKLSLLDLDRPQTSRRRISGERQSFGEQFRRMLFRQFPQWKISSLSCGMDLQRSFSPVFPRAKLTKGGHIIAAMACPTKSNEGELLTFALLWFHHLQAHCKGEAQVSLGLFLPDDAGNMTAHRLRWLRSDALRPRIFRFNEHGSAGEVDPQDLGNLQTGISAQYVPPQLGEEVRALLSRLESLPGMGCCHELTGAASIRCRGLEFARVEKGRFFLGMEERREVEISQLAEIEEFAKHLSNLAVTPAAFPERWLESVVRVNLHAVDSALQLQPVHGQVLTFAAGDRSVIDLLAVSTDGTLTVLELKASEDIQLPIQALDYWTRVKWHAERGELQHLFPATALVPTAPKLVLLAPAMSFHSATATVLSYFSPQIDVERVGVNSRWHEQFRVVLRLQGADTPISHGRFHANSRLNEYS
jgi:hypothetical protein